jgi:acetyl-CoA carboxylase biotin carboxyl carrier protein
MEHEESSDLDVIKAIVDAFERSDWAEIDVRSGSLRIHLSAEPLTSPGAAREIADRPPAAVTTATTATADVQPAKAAVIPAGAHAVLSPSPGIFWRSPHPSAPPFADVGDDVQSGTTLAIVGVMKLRKHISAGIPGTVVGVFVENGTRVYRGDALFAVQPSASP